jgi:hypothetical protein
MKNPFVYKTFTTSGTPENVRRLITDRILSLGMKQTGISESGAVTFFRYPYPFFSSRKPLTCISRLSVETRGGGGTVRVRVGASFEKIRWFTIFLMSFIWFGIPVLVGILRNSFPDFSPFGCLVVPAGIFTHYSVRGRAFRYLRTFIERAGSTS